MKKKELKAVISHVNEVNEKLKNQLSYKTMEMESLSKMMEAVSLQNRDLVREYELLKKENDRLTKEKNHYEKSLNDFSTSFEIEKVIISEKVVIVFWQDGTKTVSKCSKKDTFDVKTGLMICYAKKLLGDKEELNDFLLPYTMDKNIVDSMKDYICLDHPDEKIRKEAFKRWEALEEPIRQSVKDQFLILAKKDLVEEVLTANVIYQ